MLANCTEMFSVRFVSQYVHSFFGQSGFDFALSEQCSVYWYILYICKEKTFDYYIYIICLSMITNDQRRQRGADAEFVESADLL